MDERDDEPRLATMLIEHAPAVRGDFADRGVIEFRPAPAATSEARELPGFDLTGELIEGHINGELLDGLRSVDFPGVS